MGFRFYGVECRAYQVALVLGDSNVEHRESHVRLDRWVTSARETSTFSLCETAWTGGWAAWEGGLEAMIGPCSRSADG